MRCQRTKGSLTIKIALRSRLAGSTLTAREVFLPRYTPSAKMYLNYFFRLPRRKNSARLLDDKISVGFYTEKARRGKLILRRGENSAGLLVVEKLKPKNAQSLVYQSVARFQRLKPQKNFCRISHNFYFKFYSDYTTNAKKSTKNARFGYFTF